MLLNRLLTRDQLSIGGIFVGHIDKCCAFYFQEEENNIHMFILYTLTRRLWVALEKWLGNHVGLHHDCPSNFLLHSQQVNNKDKRIKICVIWLDTNWKIWLMRNIIMFQGKVFNFDGCLLTIKFLSHKCIGLSSKSSFFCNYYDWYTSPFNCLRTWG